MISTLLGLFAAVMVGTLVLSDQITLETPTDTDAQITHEDKAEQKESLFVSTGDACLDLRATVFPVPSEDIIDDKGECQEWRNRMEAQFSEVHDIAMTITNQDDCSEFHAHLLVIYSGYAETLTPCFRVPEVANVATAPEVPVPPQ